MWGMKALTLNQMQAALREQSEKEHQALADRSGVPFSTIRKIAYGITASPRYSTFVKLAAAMERRAA